MSAKRFRMFKVALVAGSALAAAPALAADVTPERLINPTGAAELADESSHL